MNKIEFQFDLSERKVFIMKKLLAVLFCGLILLCGCSEAEDNYGILNPGESFTVKGVVEYSDEPSDIGNEYCFVTNDKVIKYNYNDIYGEISTWSSDVFYTKGEDTELLKEYVGETVTVSGVFEAESHGVPYITDITIK